MKSTRIFLCCLALIFFSIAGKPCFAQQSALSGKPVIDTSALGTWPTLGRAVVTNDGEYSMYSYREHGANKLVIVVNKNLKETVVQKLRGNYEFTGNNKEAVFSISGDTLGEMDLSTFKVKYISNIGSFRVGEKSNWIAYLNKGPERELIVENTAGSKRMNIPQVESYDFSPDGSKLVVKTSDQNSHALFLIDPATNAQTRLWQGGNEITLTTFQKNSYNIAFVAAGVGNNDTLYYYDTQQAARQQFALNVIPFNKIDKQTIANLEFSKNGDKLFICVVSFVTAPRPPAKNPGVIVWNYKETYQKYWQKTTGYRLQWWYAIDLSSKHVTRLSNGNLHLQAERQMQVGKTEKYLLFSDSRSIDYDSFDTVHYRNLLYVISTSDGSENLLSKGHDHGGETLSPNERFAVWFDYEDLSYYSYNIASSKKIRLQIPFPPYDEDPGHYRQQIHQNEAFPIGGWSANGNYAFIRDSYDIWKVDITGREPAVNITNGFGRKHHISFSLIDPTYVFSNMEKFVDLQQPLIIQGFDVNNKNEGFWKLTKIGKDPEMLDMEPCHYQVEVTTPTISAGNNSAIPFYILSRETASEYPNMYLTKDFETFKPLSSLHPEKGYNWLNSELVSWITASGHKLQGVLYKPENFDSNKKYPVIFNYFIRMSDDLHTYEEPDWTTNNIDIAYFVSNGYLIFKPDIYYTKGQIGKSAVEALTSAAHCLSARPYIDSAKMAIVGHSFGALETNYLETHTNIFAAACTQSGFSDLVSVYDQGSNVDNGDFPAKYLQEMTLAPYFPEVNAPWNDSTYYIGNSPIFSVDKASTPLLMMAGETDISTPFAQATEMYRAMHRAGKKVWLLDYPKSGHAVYGIYSKDFTIRLKQFFDYYLKGSPPPVWMTKGVAREDAGLQSGLEIDESGTKP